MSILAIPGAVVGAAHTAIQALSGLFVPSLGVVAAAVAIVVFTLLVRLLISPLTYLQVRGERRRAALAPQIEKLRAKHGDDPMTLATETLALQRANGISPFAFLPALAQAPFFMVLYRVALDAPAGSLFGVPLNAHLAAGLPVFAVLIALAGALAWWSSRRMSQMSGGAVGASAGGAASAGGRAVGAEKPGKAAPQSADPAAALKFMKYLPYLSVLAVAWMPLAGGLYLVTSTAWTALEHAIWRRPVTTGNR
ncbi:YidC/Oxa1 family membrane protein insertase [Actinoplanes sp. CA-030573]|uniref:YidC/Oxa1 family membrane protein insertase n=1 Tax=Actinoplanes sp. CA-030573 TaxID=3239898 RepID=UPI003D92C136